MDAADLAAPEIDNMVQDQIARIRAKPKARRLSPIGQCHNCRETLKEEGQLFCDTDCRDDYQRLGPG